MSKIIYPPNRNVDESMNLLKLLKMPDKYAGMVSRMLKTKHRPMETLTGNPRKDVVVMAAKQS